MTRGTAAGSQRSEKERYSDSWQTENATSQNTVPLLSLVRPPACHESEYCSSAPPREASGLPRVEIPFRDRIGTLGEGAIARHARRRAPARPHVIPSGAHGVMRPSCHPERSEPKASVVEGSRVAAWR